MDTLSQWPQSTPKTTNPSILDPLIGQSISPLNWPKYSDNSRAQLCIMYRYTSDYWAYFSTKCFLVLFLYDTQPTINHQVSKYGQKSKIKYFKDSTKNT